MFSGLSAFPLTPMNECGLDEVAFVRLIERLVTANVDSIGVLGSTGNYAYLTKAERARVLRLAVEHAGNIPVVAGIGALRARDVLTLAEDAEAVGVSGLLMAPMSYQKLLPEEVFGLYEAVTQVISLPLCIYDNLGTTQFVFSDDLHGQIAQLPNVASIKIPGVAGDPVEAKLRVARLRAQIPSHVTIGVSGDASAANGLNAGCDAWYSVIGGVFPITALEIIRAAQARNEQEAISLSERLLPLWELFTEYGGSLRVVAAAAELQGFVESPCLPLPLKSLSGAGRRRLGELIDELNLY